MLPSRFSIRREKVRVTNRYFLLSRVGMAVFRVDSRVEIEVE